MNRRRIGLLLTMVAVFGVASCGLPVANEPLVSSVVSQSSYNLSGTALVITNSIWGEGRMLLADLESGKQTVLVDKKGVFGPTFSPDGKRVAYALNERIYTIRLDGTDNQEITYCAPNTAGSSGGLKSPQQPSLTWGRDNKIYWSEFTKFIWQVDTISRTRKKIYTSQTQNWRGQVSLDGQRAVVWKSRPEFDDSYAYTIDIKNNREDRVRTGCNVAISPDGNHIFHMIDPHTKGGQYRQFDHSYVKDLPPPSGATDAGNYRFSTFSPAYLCVTANPNGSINSPYVLDVKSDTYYPVGGGSLNGTIWDFLPDSIDQDSNQEPSKVEIVSPFDGDSFASGTQITFWGTAQDPEDGSLTGNALSWVIDAVSDGQGPIRKFSGNHKTFNVPVL